MQYTEFIDVVRTHKPINPFVMKNIILIIALALASSVNAQILNDILDGTHNPFGSVELSSTVLLTLSPQNGIPNEVVVFKIADFDPSLIYESGMNPSTSKDVRIYASIGGTETVTLPLYEEGVYSIICIDSNNNYVGEGVSIVVNENFISGLLRLGYAEKRNGLVVSTKPLRIGRDESEFVSFN